MTGKGIIDAWKVIPNFNAVLWRTKLNKNPRYDKIIIVFPNIFNIVKM
jgi:hypothetical protein